MGRMNWYYDNMKVVVDANFKVMGRFEPPIVFEFHQEEVTIAELLRRLQQLLPHINFLEKDLPGDDLRQLKVNQDHMPITLDVLGFPLKDGDEVFVGIYLEPLGGG